jgi:hypothetical protein
MQYPPGSKRDSIRVILQYRPFILLGSLSMKHLKKELLALIAIAATLGALWFTNRSVTPKAAIWDDVVAEAKTGGYQLIVADKLRERFQKDPEGLLVVDTRQEWEYRTGHIKGAVNFPMEPTWLSRWQKKGELAALLGPDKGRPVAFY